jgi:hypothetical protein
MAGKEFGDSLGAQVVKILTSSASKPLLKKKAALCLLRMCAPHVPCLPAAQRCVWFQCSAVGPIVHARTRAGGTVCAGG